MKRKFFVIGSFGSDSVEAESAAEASRSSRMVGGLKHELAVIDSAFIAHVPRLLSASGGIPLRSSGEGDARFVVLVGESSTRGDAR